MAELVFTDITSIDPSQCTVVERSNRLQHFWCLHAAGHFALLHRATPYYKRGKELYGHFRLATPFTMPDSPCLPVTFNREQQLEWTPKTTTYPPAARRATFTTAPCRPIKLSQLLKNCTFLQLKMEAIPNVLFWCIYAQCRIYNKHSCTMHRAYGEKLLQKTHSWRGICGQNTQKLQGGPYPSQP